jgi:hypothetical protein
MITYNFFRSPSLLCVIFAFIIGLGGECDANVVTATTPSSSFCALSMSSIHWQFAV